MSTHGMGLLRQGCRAYVGWGRGSPFVAAVLTAAWVSAASVSAACVSAAWIAAAQAREFRAADIQEETYPTVQALRVMDQLVAERTGNRHRIRVFPARQLGEESQTIEQT